MAQVNPATAHPGEGQGAPHAVPGHPVPVCLGGPAPRGGEQLPAEPGRARRPAPERHALGKAGGGGDGPAPEGRSGVREGDLRPPALHAPGRHPPACPRTSRPGSSPCSGDTGEPRAKPPRPARRSNRTTAPPRAGSSRTYPSTSTSTTANPAGLRNGSWPQGAAADADAPTPTPLQNLAAAPPKGPNPAHGPDAAPAPGQPRRRAPNAARAGPQRGQSGSQNAAWILGYLYIEKKLLEYFQYPSIHLTFVFELPLKHPGSQYPPSIHSIHCYELLY